MAAPMYAGSCLCGQTRYRLTGEPRQLICCHCTRCQKGTGSAHAANIFAPGAQLEWVEGSENVALFQVPETRHARAFCRQCGSPVPFVQMNGAVVVVPAGSLDTPLSLTPAAHIWCESGSAWQAGLAEAPQFEQMPPATFFSRIS